MELGLSLGDSSKSFGCRANAREIKTATATATAASAAAAKDLGFCMALGINPCGGGGITTDQEPKQKQVLVHQDDGYEEEEEEDGTDQEEDDENSIVQLDLLPRAPVPRRTPWSSDNGSSEGGSSGNKGLDVNRLPGMATAMATEEATSSFRMDMGMYRRSGSKRDLDGNDAVEAERASSRASDEDENGLSRKKLRLSKEQSAYLEESFKEHNTLNPKQKQALAKQLNLRPRQVEVWFQNRRARTKLKQTEVDCEYLKRCCETLTEENRRLQKELQELRALKSSSNNPFYMQLPATTLTMCPSCERVATSSTTVHPPPTTPSTSKATDLMISSKLTTPFPVSSSNKPRSLFQFSNPKTTPT